MILGLVAAYRYAILTSGLPIIQASALSFSDLIFLALVIAFFIVITRFKRIGRIIFWIFLSLVILSGSQIVLNIWLSSPWDIVGSLIVVVAFIAWHNVLIHDIGITLALAGIGANLGLSITPTLAIIGLLVLSFYDIIAVYKTRHMVKMAEGMIQSGAIFGFIIPSDFKLFFTNRSQAQAQLGEQFMILGSGDIALPIIFASSLMRQSLGEAIMVAVFAVLGIFLTHLLFVNQPKRQAMAALPPIATMCLVGYIVALLFGI